jgi:7,8-dihydroneopterin aldolase/epimerase/oxygenase
VVATESHLLLERVAQRIADVLLDADDRIDAVRVSIRKLRPPIPVDVDTSAVTITRRR